MKHWQTWALLVVLSVGLAGPAAWADPPRWAPAHGHRRKHRVVHYVAAPFIYSGVTYIPLRDVTSLIGAALLWNSLEGRAVITYNGREIGLAVGSPTVVYGGETVVLTAAPVIVGGVVYVPATFCERTLGVPLKHSGRKLMLQGPKGWHEYRVASAPPGRVSFGRAARPRHAAAPGPVRVRPHDRKGREGRPRTEVRAFGKPKRDAKVPRERRAAGRADKQRGEGQGGHGRGGGKHKQ